MTDVALSLVTLELGCEPVDVPALWLRDNCPCDDCRVTTTTEHRFNVADYPANMAPVAVCNGPAGVVHVDWGDHTSTYSALWWAEMRCQATRSIPESVSWQPDFVEPRFDYQAVMHDRATELEFLDAYTTLGVAVVTGTPTEPGSVEPFISRWAPPWEVPFARIHDVAVDPAGYNIAHTAEALPPHNDMASKRSRPSGQILHMLVNEADGGNTILVDAFAIADQLTEQQLDVLATVPVSFRQFSATVETWARASLIRRNEVGRVIGLRYSNQLLQALDPTLPKAAEWYAAYHRLSSLIMDPANQLRFRLNSGDLLMVHGHRVLHGRTAFNPGTGARHLQDIYFDYDDVANEAYRLRYRS